MIADICFDVYTMIVVVLVFVICVNYVCWAGGLYYGE